MSLRTKRVIVAGGSGLIGSAVVQALHERKAYILSADIKDGDVYFDMAKPESILASIDFFGVPDIFINAAYPRDFVAHALGTIDTAKIMIAKGCTNIILFSSIYGLRAPDFSLYTDTDVDPPSEEYAFLKRGIIGLTEYLAKKHAPRVRVNAIAPGGVIDDQGKEFVKRYEQRTPLGRMATVHDVVKVVLFLASDDASEYITGQVIPVDGGRTL